MATLVAATLLAVAGSSRAVLAQEADLGPSYSGKATTYDALVCSYDWPCREALNVMWCESKGYAPAYSQGNYGLFQINGIHRARVGGDAERFFDPETNVRVAYAIWSEQGWRPWGCGFAAYQ